MIIIYEYIWWVFNKCKSMCTWTLWTWQSVCFQVRWRGASSMSWFNSLTHVLLKCLHRNEAISVASQIGRVFQQGSGIFLRDWHCPILRQKDMFSRSKKHQTTNFLMFGVGFYPDIHETLESFAGHVSLDCDPRKKFWSNYGNLQRPRWKS